MFGHKHCSPYHSWFYIHGSWGYMQRRCQECDKREVLTDKGWEEQPKPLSAKELAKELSDAFFEPFEKNRR